MLVGKGTRLHRLKTRIDSRARRQSVNKLNISIRRITLAKEYRKTLRSRVHRITTEPATFGPELAKEIQSAKGQIGYLGKFHETEVKRLKSKIQEFEQMQAAV